MGPLSTVAHLGATVSDTTDRSASTPHQLDGEATKSPIDSDAAPEWLSDATSKLQQLEQAERRASLDQESSVAAAAAAVKAAAQMQAGSMAEVTRLANEMRALTSAILTSPGATPIATPVPTPVATPLKEAYHGGAAGASEAGSRRDRTEGMGSTMSSARQSLAPDAPTPPPLRAPIVSTSEEEEADGRHATASSSSSVFVPSPRRAPLACTAHERHMAHGTDQSGSARKGDEGKGATSFEETNAVANDSDWLSGLGKAWSDAMDQLKGVAQPPPLCGINTPSKTNSREYANAVVGDETGRAVNQQMAHSRGPRCEPAVASTGSDTPARAQLQTQSRHAEPSLANRGERPRAEAPSGSAALRRPLPQLGASCDGDLIAE